MIVKIRTSDQTIRFVLYAVVLLTPKTIAGLETLSPLRDGVAPQTFEEMWAGFDPRAEPLEIEVLSEWEEDGVVLKVLRYRIGVFKGRKAMMAAVYGNVVYPLDRPITGAGYYYAIYTADRFNLSSLMQVATADELKAAGVRATLKPSLVIETFAGDWQKEWFTYRPESWARRTHKIYDPQWHAPASAELALEVRSAQANIFVVGLDGYAAEVILNGGDEWQSVMLRPADLHDADGNALSHWTGLKELRLGPQETLRSKKDGAKPVSLGGDWRGAVPEFRNLRWMAVTGNN